MCLAKAANRRDLLEDLGARVRKLPDFRPLPPEDGKNGVSRTGCMVERRMGERVTELETGDHESFRARVEKLYLSAGPRLWRAVYAYSGDRDIADDTVAETFAQLLRRGSDVSRLDAWLWTTAFRVAKGLLAERSSHWSTAMSPRDEPILADDSFQLVDHLVTALRQLPRQQRLAVVLRDYADRPSSEVAEYMGVRVATMFVHLSRARRRLRVLLGEEGEDEAF